MQVISGGGAGFDPAAHRAETRVEPGPNKPPSQQRAEPRCHCQEAPFCYGNTNALKPEIQRMGVAVVVGRPARTCMCVCAVRIIGLHTEGNNSADTGFIRQYYLLLVQAL